MGRGRRKLWARYRGVDSTVRLSGPQGKPTGRGHKAKGPCEYESQGPFGDRYR